MTVSIEGIITCSAVLAAAGAILGYYNKLLHWVERQNRQDRAIAELRQEQTLLTYGVLACLKGLKEQGCNGPVTHAIDKIEKHLNEKAHEGRDLND